MLRIMGDLGDLLRVQLKKKKKLKLKVRNDIGKAYTAEEKERMLYVGAISVSIQVLLSDLSTIDVSLEHKQRCRAG